MQFNFFQVVKVEGNVYVFQLDNITKLIDICNMWKVTDLVKTTLDASYFSVDWFIKTLLQPYYNVSAWWSLAAFTEQVVYLNLTT